MKKTPLKRMTCALALGLAACGMSLARAADVRVCMFPGSPSVALDTQVVSAVLQHIGMRAVAVPHAIREGDDDGISLGALGGILKNKCDIVAGFPRSNVADAVHDGVLLSRPYLRTGYAAFRRQDAGAKRDKAGRLAVTYGSPAQLIAVREKGALLDFEVTTEDTVAAVASGKAQRGIAWYPAIVAYQHEHPQVRFKVRAVASDYGHWDLVMMFGQRNAALRKRFDAGLEQMAATGALARLTETWRIAAGNAKTSTASDARDAGPDRVIASHAFAALDRSAHFVGNLNPSLLRVAAAAGQADIMGPSFTQAQALHGHDVYAANCAKCHGAQLQGNVGPALQGPAFAPATGSSLTLSGIFNYMQSNMPADQPGKLKAQDYADVMAFLLMRNGYQSGTSKLTAAKALKSQALLESHAAM